MAGYNNYFPQTYTNSPYVYSAASQPGVSWAQPTTTSSQLSSINWVQGEAGARSVPVPPGQKALLMDSETNVFYVKSSDTSGMPLPLRIFEYKEIDRVATNTTDGREDKYVTHEELNKILAELKGEPKEEKKNEPQFLI